MNPKLGAPPRADRTMTDGYKLLRELIPHGHMADVAEMMNVSIRTVESWCAQPSTTETPDQRGRRNPIDNFDLLLHAIFLVNPEEVGKLEDLVKSRIANLRQRHRQAHGIPVEEIEGKLRDVQRMMADITDALAGQKE